MTEPVDLLLINGVFSTTLDFGSSAFTGGDRFVEISVRPNGSPNAYVVLGARQQIFSVPYAVRSANATNADNATNAQNAVNAVNATNATSATTAQNSLSLGGHPAGNYARLNFANQGDVSAANLGAAGYVSAGGNALQSLPSFGFPKAMAEIHEDGLSATVNRCYNGISGASTPATCGFTVTGNMGPTGTLTGAFLINFGFPVNNRFVYAVPKYRAGVTGGSGPSNFGINYRFDLVNNNVIQLFTFVADEPDDTVPCDFMVIVY